MVFKKLNDKMQKKFRGTPIGQLYGINEHLAVIAHDLDILVENKFQHHDN